MPEPDAQYTDHRLIGIYDLLNAGDRDFVFYESHIGPSPKRVLDLGCGTGTFALRLANSGHQVIGIDPAAAMIEYARSRPYADCVRWLNGDAQAIPVDETFDAVTMTGHSFQCLQTDDAVRDTARIVRAHLAEGGRFMFESRNPAVQAWRNWTPENTRRVVHSDELGRVDIYHTDAIRDEEFVDFKTHYLIERDHTHLTNTSRLRFMSHSKIAECLSAAGFQHIEWYGDWSGDKLNSHASEELIAICHA